jgi:uncharacterized protein (TIGR03435 family)
VLDRTELTGNFDVDLQWTPAAPGASPVTSVVTALQEQLGLKLDAQTDVMDVLVIDHVEKPTRYDDFVSAGPPPPPPPPPPPQRRS